jgi:hypothetical protein
METSTLVWGVIFGAIGLGFFAYGKKQKAIIPFLSGIGLILCPYFISNVFALVITCIVLTIVPFVVKI